MRKIRSKFILSGIAGLLACAACAVELVFNAGVEQSMTFNATFDAGIAADSAAGEKAGKLVAQVPEDKLLVPGVRNKALRIGLSPDRKERHSVDYSPAGNISSHTGTVMFWVKSEDWQAAGKQFNMFFAARSPHESLFIYKYSGGNLYFLLGPPKGDKSIAMANISKWLPGEWHFITCAWTPESLWLYVDGSLKGAVQRKSFNGADFTSMQVGSAGWEVEAGLSAIDDIRIFSKALETDAIASEHAKYGMRDKEKNSLVTVGAKTPGLDGKIKDGEYAFGGAGFLDTNGKYADRQSRYFLSHDQENLYVAVSSPQQTPPKADCGSRDGSVWLDDSVEVWLNRPKEDVSYQIIVNSKGAVYDARLQGGGADREWEAKGLRSASGVENGAWTVEIAIPLKDIAAKPGEEMFVNVCRTFQSDGGYFSCVAPVRRNVGYSDKANFFKLAFDPAAPVVDFSSVGGLNSGDLSFKLASPSSDVSCKINYATTEKSWVDETLQCASGAKSASFSLERKSLNAGGSLSVEILSGKNVVYRGFFDAKPTSPVTVSHIYTDIPKQLFRTVVKNESGVDGGEMVLSLTDRKTKERLENRFPVKRGQLISELSWDIAKLPCADYDFESVYVDKDGKAGEKFVQFYRKSPSPAPWDNLKAGIYADVPAPWAPLKSDASRTAALKQTYSFGKALLPVEIAANGRVITTRPAVVTIDGKTDAGAGSSEFAGGTPRKALYKTSAQIGGVRVSADVRVEYDGMVWVDMSMSPASGQPVEIKSMTIDIPLKKEFAEQVHANGGDTHRAKSGGTGLVPASGWNKDLFEKPAFWVGNDDAGFSWFAENLKGWHTRKHERSVEIIPASSESVVRLNIVDSPLKLGAERKLSFGFQGTPVKNPNNGSRFNRIGPEWGMYWAPFSFFNYYDTAPEFVDAKAVSNYDKSSKGKRSFHYIGSNGASPYMPEWGYWGRLWTSRPLGEYIIETDVRTIEKRNKWVWTYACLNCESFRNFIIWQLDNCMEPMNITDLYYDLVGPRMCNNAEHGCGWQDDFGNKYHTMNLLGCREFQMRVYELMKKKRPDSMHLFHVTNAPSISAVDSFSDALVEGETFFGNELVEKETYFGIYTPELFRVSYYGGKWGTPVIYIPQFSRAAYFFKPEREKLWSQENPPAAMRKAMRHFLGYVLVHDTGVWSAMQAIYKDQGAAWKVMRDFLGGWDGREEFLPYWDAKSPVKVSSSNPARVIASVYKRGDKAVAVVMNDTAAAQDIGISVDAERLFKKACKAVVMNADGSGAPAKDNVWQASVPDQDFAIYLIKCE